VNVTGIIHDDWASEPSVRDACLHLWQALSEKESHLDHYTFDDLQKFAEVADHAVVAQALLYLSNPKLRVLRTCLMYEFNGGYFELPAEEVEHYSKGEGVIHPEYGEPVDESEILVCFTPGAGLHQKAAS